MNRSFFWLALACVGCVGTFALVHPSHDSMEMLKEISIGVLVGKYALAAPSPSK